MADPIKKEEEEVISIPAKDLAAIHEQLASMEIKQAELEANNAGLAELIASGKGVDTVGEKKLREKKDFEPKFRTLRIRKFPIAGDPENLGYVVGWTNRGAYQKVDRTGVTPLTVDMIQIVFLDNEKTKDGKLKVEEVRLLDLMNAPQVYCKILDVKKDVRKEPTGEEIVASTYDEKHGLTQTGEILDGYVEFTDMTYTIEIPGRAEPVIIDGLFAN